MRDRDGVFSAIERERTKLSQALEIARREGEQATSALLQVDHTVNQWRQCLEECTRERDDARRQLSALHQTAGEIRAALEQSSAERQSAYEAYTAEVERVRAEAEGRIDLYTAEVERVRAEAEGRIDLFTAEVERVRAEAEGRIDAAREAQAIALHGSDNEHAEERRALRAEIDEARATTAELRTKLDEALATLDAVTRELEVARGGVADLVSERTELITWHERTLEAERAKADLVTSELSREVACAEDRLAWTVGSLKGLAFAEREAHAAELGAVLAVHAAELGAVLAMHSAELGAITDQHAAELVWQSASHTAETGAIKEAWAFDVSALKDTHCDEVGALKNRYAAETTAMAETHTAQTEALTDAHAMEVAMLQSGANAALEEKDARIAEVEAELERRMRDAVSNLLEEHERALGQVREAREQESAVLEDVAASEARVADLERELETTREALGTYAVECAARLEAADQQVQELRNYRDRYATRLAAAMEQLKAMTTTAESAAREQTGELRSLASLVGTLTARLVIDGASALAARWGREVPAENDLDEAISALADDLPEVVAAELWASRDSFMARCQGVN